MNNDLTIRLATSADQPGIIALIDSVYGEYGDTVFLEGAEADLLAIDTQYFDRGGAFWVLESDSIVVGSHAALPDPNNQGVCNFKRLYLAKQFRGTKWGHELMQITIDWARDQGFQRVEFWSDTRFSRAHRFFEKFGFERTGQIRDMDDAIDPYSEYFYFLNLHA